MDRTTEWGGHLKFLLRLTLSPNGNAGEANVETSLLASALIRRAT
ncbi:hypothetical protein SAMN04488583_5330 [Mycobacterium sp. 88mf]|nr:hypothetical protein SAMN04488583_5330 [Mycobacterium sp. 88mf]SFG05737.1 hypothetical protein SAMN04488582_10599 [Mycobacterium sp. 455mf]